MCSHGARQLPAVLVGASMSGGTSLVATGPVRHRHLTGRIAECTSLDDQVEDANRK